MSTDEQLIDELNGLYHRYRLIGHSDDSAGITSHQLPHMRRLINAAITFVDTNRVPTYVLTLSGIQLAALGINVNAIIRSPLTELPLLSTAFEYAINHFGGHRLGERLRVRLTSVGADTTIHAARTQLDHLVSIVGTVFSTSGFELLRGSLCQRIYVETTNNADRLNAQSLSTVAVHLSDELIHGAPIGATVRVVGIVKDTHVDAISVTVIDCREAVDSANDSSLVEQIIKYTQHERANCGGVLPMLVASLLYNVKQLRDDYEMQKAAVLLAALSQDLTNKVHSLILCHNAVIDQSLLTQYLCRILPRSQYAHIDEPKIGVDLSVDRVGERMIVYHRLALSDDGLLIVDGLNSHSGHLDNICECIIYRSLQVAELPRINVNPTVMAAFNLPTGYDRSSPVIDYIKFIPHNLLKQFPLKIVFADRGDGMSDAMTSRLALDENARMGRGTQEVATLNENESQRFKRETIMRSSTTFSIHHHMQMYDGQKLNDESMRAFLRYALHNCHPKLSDAAQRILIDAFQRLSKEYAPMDVDLLRTLKSMTVARARIELSPIANASHAQDVDDIVSALFRHVSHRTQVCVVANNKPLSKSKRIKLMISVLTKQSALQKNRIFSVREINDIALALIDRTMTDIELTDMVRELREKYSLLVQRDGGYVIAPKAE